MANKILIAGLVALTLTACAGRQPAADEATISRAGGKGHDWKSVTEAEVAAELDATLVEASKTFVKLRKDGEIVFCKRLKQMGSNIPTLQCITQAQLRTQVEHMDQYRDRMRSTGKCPHGPQGCSSQ